MGDGDRVGRLLLGLLLGGDDESYRCRVVEDVGRIVF